ncbi:hypothetical protein [Falsiruegeria mediterranea]|uniref:Uncharacterized protein n=1 Tax=Falsiruegeria mediterranea M17 TaxID=1200281 RepID=A0A2R8C5A9_9RHOB|nr:hypothetical protein [Falsiruegeria mediterranea]SPJ27621.1 hypothetical protein TRM7615_01111 [Falsiruegeria mediterranea M17]
MSAVIGALRGVLSLDSAAFETGAKRSMATMGTVERRMVRFAGKMEGAGRRLSLGFTAPMAAMAAVALKSSLSVVDSQAKMAQSLGTTVKSMQVLDRAADLSGVSIGEVEQATIQLTKRLSQVESGGAKGAAKALERLHLTAQDLHRLPLDERLEAIQTAMSRYVPEAERAAIASELFGSRAGVVFSRIDASALRVAAQDVSRFGVAVSEVDADQIERTNDAVSRLGLVGRGVANQITVALAPAIEGISDRIALAGEWFAGLNDKAKQSIAIAGTLTATVGPLALGLGAILKVAAPLVGVVASLATPVGVVVAGLALAATVGTAFAGSMRDTTSFAEAHALAMDNVTYAMGDQYRATARLADALREGGPVTLATIEAKMAEAEARQAVTAALVRERQEKELEALGYYQVLEAIGQYQAALTSMRAPGDDLEQMPVKLRAAYEETEQALVRALTEQRRLLDGVRSQTHLTKEEQANLEQISANIAELQRRWNTLKGITSENVDLTERNVVAAGNLAGNIGQAAGQAANLKSFLSGLPGALASADAKIAGLRAGISALASGGGELSANVAKYRAELEASLPALDSMHDGQRRQVQAGIDQRVQQYELEQQLTKEYQDRTAALNKLNTASGGSGGAKKVESQLTREITQRRTLLGLAGKERQMYQAVLSVQQRLGTEAGKYSQAQIKALAGQVVALDDAEAATRRVADQQSRWADNITRTAFEGGSLGDTVKGMLKDIAFQFANTRFTLPIIASVTGFLGLDRLALGGTAGAVLGEGGGGGGLLGGLLGSQASGLLGGGGFLGGGGLLGGIGSGLGGVLSGGGLGASFANLGGLVSGSVGGLGAIGAALPAVGALLAGVYALSKAFSRKYAGTALRGTLGVDGFDGTQFDFYKGGAFRSNKAVYKPVPDEIQASLDTTMRGVTTGLKAMALTLGLSSSALAEFNDEQFTLWTNGKTQAQIQEELSGHIDVASEKMAALVLGTDAFSRTGESAQETLKRLSDSLSAANDMADLLGHRAFAVSLAGADAASHLSDVFGGIEAMSAATSAYLQAVYSESERSEITLRRLRDTFGDLGLVMPESRAQLRAMVEGFDTTTESGRNAYAEVIKLSGALDSVLPKVGALAISVTGLVDQIGGALGAQLDDARKMVTESKSAASLWYRVSESLRDFLRQLVGSNLGGAGRDQAAAANRASLDAVLQKARGGDAEAARDVPGLVNAYLANARATSRSDLEYRRLAGQLQGEVKFLAGLAELEGANQDVLQGLYQQQVDVLTGLSNFLQLEGLTNEQIGKLDVSIQDLARDFDGTLADFQDSLAGLEGAIKEAEAFSYDALKQRLQVAVDLLPQVDIPDYLKALIRSAETGLTSTIDFVVRSDLPAPDKWLALNTASEHIKAISFVLDGNDIAPETRDLALATGGDLRRTLQFVVGADLDDQTRRLALVGNSELVRTVNAALSSGADPRAVRLALQNVGTFDVAVRAALSHSVGWDVRKLVLGGVQTFSVSVLAALSEGVPSGLQRALLSEQGRLALNIEAILNAGVPEPVRALLLKSNTAALRAVTIDAVYGASLNSADLELLRETSSTAKRVINAQLNSPEFTTTETALLRQLNLGTGTVQRVIKGLVDTGSLTSEQKALLASISGASSGTITLGGSFRFDPSAGFSSWFGTTLQSGIAAPMTDLTGALGALRKAITDQPKQAALDGYAAGMLRNDKGQYIATEQQLNKLAELAGVNTNGTANQLAYRVKSFSASDKLDDIYVDRSGYQTRRALLGLVGSAGLKVKPEAYLNAYGDVQRAGVGAQRHFDQYGQDEIASGRRVFKPGALDWSSIGLNVPGHAAGGAHQGGWRIVGETGWELEHTGPSRVISNSDASAMLDQRNVVSVLDLLRRDFAQAIARLGQINDRVRSSDKTLQKLDLDGVKQRDAAS